MRVKIIVLLKQTPDTEVAIKIAADPSKIDEANMKYIINPYDEFAVEQALLTVAETGPGEVVVLSFGDDSYKERMVRALAMGADRGLLLSNEGLKDADAFVISQILAKAISEEKPDIVLCGKQAIDDDNMHVPTMVA